MPRTRRPKGRSRGPGALHHGADYTDEEREAIVAVDRHRRRTGRKFLSLTEVLEVLRGLGWRKE